MASLFATRSYIRRLTQYRQTLLAFAASGVNQIFGSATNLIIGVYLIRHMVPSEFGLYNISFAITITVAAIANSVFLIPMTVGIPQGDPAGRDQFMLNYITTAGVCMIALGLSGALGVLIAIWGGWIDSKNAIFALVTITSCIGFFLKDAMVQAGYNQGRESTTILINVASATAIAGLILASALFLKVVTAPWAVVGYVISQAIAFGVGYLLVFRGMKFPTFEALKVTTAKLLGKAFWPACASALSLLRTQAHTLVVASLIGPAGVAAINASRLVFAPVQMAQPALVRAAMPRLVRQLHIDRRRFQRSTIAITVGLGIFSLLYCLLVTASGPWLFPIVAGRKYQYSALMLLAWGCYITLVALRSGIELNQQALQRFRGLAGVNVPASAVSVVGAFLLTRFSGPPGAMFGLALGEATIILLLSLKVRRTV